MKYYIWIFALLITLINTSCRKPQADTTAIDALARVGDKYLTRQEFIKVLPNNISTEDSIYFAHQYIDNWVMREIIYRKALINIDDNMNDVGKKIETFKEDLYINTYEELLVNSRLKKIKISESEIEQYYNEHKEEFFLNEDVVRADFIQIPKKLGENEKLLIWLKSDNYDDYERLKEYSYQFADKFYFGNENWISARDLMSKVPIKSPQADFFKHNKYYTAQDSTSFYLVHIYEFMYENQQAPLSYSQKAIKQVLLQKKKHDIIKSVRNKLYEDALHKNVLEIY